MNAARLPDPIRCLALVLGLAAVYFASARLGLLLQLPGTNASPVWPPSGIGLAAVLLFGLRVWPGIAVGAFLANLLTLPPTTAGLTAATAIAVGNTLESVVALLVLRRWVPTLSPFDAPGDLLRFLATVAGACAVAGTIGATSLWLTGIVPGHLYSSVWFTWWLGDAAGILVLTPALVCWWRAPRLGLSARRGWELAALMVVTALTAELTFGGWFSVAVPFLVLAGPLWVAFRFGPRETALLPVLLSAITIVHVWHWAERGTGPGVYVPFVSGASGANNSLLMIQLFVCAVGMTAVILAAAVAQRTRTEGQLRDSESRYRVLIEALPQLVWTCLPDGQCDYLSRQWVEYTGVSEADQLGYGWSESVHPDDRPRLMETWQRAVREGGPFDVEFRIRNARGEYRWFKTRAVLFNLNNSGGSKWFGTNTDIDDQKHAEAQLRELNVTLERRVAERTAALQQSEQRFRAIFHAQFQFIGLMAPDGTLLEANRTALAAAGVAEQAVLGKPFWETPWWTHDPVQQNQLRAAVRRAAAGEQVRFEASHPAPDGLLIWVDFSLTPFRDESGVVVLLIPEGRDITARKRIERTLEEKTQLLGTVLDSIGDAVLVADPEGQIVLRNPAFRRLHEGQPDIGPGGDWARENGVYLPGGEVLCPHEQLPLVRAMRGEPTDDIELEIVSGRHPDGVPIRVTGRPLVGSEGIAGGVIVIRDVSARKHAEEALRASEERFRVLTENAPVGIFETDADGNCLFVNARWCEMAGMTVPAAAGAGWTSAIDPDDRDRIATEWYAAAAQGREFASEYRFRTPQGRVTWLSGRALALPGAGGRPRGYLGTITDITARRRAEETLTASLREKEVLLKEIHHRVKNNLQIVSTLLDLQSGYTADSQALEMFQESRGRVKSMALIHERLYRSQDMARVNFSEYVRQLADDLYRTYKVRDDIRLEIEVDVPPLPIDLAIPCGLLLNELVSNCFKHAFKGAAEGRVFVGLTADPDGTNVLVVSDDGAGFPAGIDFRNTASFGLQLVHTLVEQLAGEIELAPGRGTTFTVRFANTK